MTLNPKPQTLERTIAQLVLMACWYSPYIITILERGGGGGRTPGVFIKGGGGIHTSGGVVPTGRVGKPL